MIIEHIKPDLIRDNNSINNLKQLVEDNALPAFLCTNTNINNPNHLAIIHINKKFSENFQISAAEAIDKSYDFLFEEPDINYSSDDQIEYINLVKSIKALHQCEVELKLNSAHENQASSGIFKINFIPVLQEKIDNDKNKLYAIFTFEKLTNDSTINGANNKHHSHLVQKLERALNSEKMLREISYLIISDKTVKEIAETITKSLYKYLKIDRCIIYDYKNGKTSFIFEECNPNIKPILDGSEDGLHDANGYIEFQNNFYNKIKPANKRSSIFVVENVHTDPIFSQIAPFYEKFSITSQISAITALDGEINGGIYIQQSQKRMWSLDEIELIEIVTDHLAMAIDRSTSIEKIMIANHNLLTRTLELKEAIKKEKEMRKIQSEFIALVSHEFKTPLQIIDSTRELIARKIKSLQLPDDSLEKYLERIKSGIQRLGGLISTTLDLAKIESGEEKIKAEKQSVNLHSLLTEIIDKTTNLANNKNIKIITNFCKEDATINGDAKLLDHCFTNIISNAIKYSHDNSSVQIITKTNDTKIGVRIIDHGIGIPTEDLNNVGKKFFRAKNTLSVSGTGIGLYLTKYFIELHKGNVLIRSKLNIGTVVTVVLPKF